MKAKYLLVPFILPAILAIGCTPEQSAEYTTETVNDTMVTDTLAQIPAEENLAIAIDTFNTFPPEIDGCACYFAHDSVQLKSSRYIYADNYDKLAFVSINGSMVKFIQQEVKEVNEKTTRSTYTAKGYDMMLELTEGARSGDETWHKTGIIRITDKAGNTIQTTFFGECGC